MQDRVGDDFPDRPARNLVDVPAHNTAQVGTHVHLLEGIEVRTVDLRHEVARDVSPVKKDGTGIILEDGALQRTHELGIARQDEVGIRWKNLAVSLTKQPPGQQLSFGHTADEGLSLLGCTREGDLVHPVAQGLYLLVRHRKAPARQPVIPSLGALLAQHARPLEVRMTRGSAHAHVHAGLEPLGLEVVGAAPANRHLDQDKALAPHALHRYLREHLWLNGVHNGIGNGVRLLEDLFLRNADNLASLVVHAKD